MSNLDRIAAALARDQQGLVSAAQLQAAGVSARTVSRRVRDGAWCRRADGSIDVMTHQDGWEKDARGLLLAAGPDALLSHRTAAVVHRMIDCTRPPRIDVLVPRRQHAEVRRIRLHTTVRLLDAERADVDGFAVTSVARTIVDTAARRTDDWVQLAMADALRQGATSRELLLSSILARPGAVDTRRLLAALASMPEDVGATESPLEVMGVLAMARMGLPSPVLQHRVQVAGRRYRLDVAWPARRVHAELDGVRFHGTSLRRARDQERAAHLGAAGWTGVAITYSDVLEAPASAPFRRLAMLLL